MSLPKSFTTVTPFSKVLAMILFIFLPFIGFSFGIKYQSSLVAIQPLPSSTFVKDSTFVGISPTPKPLPDNRPCVSGEIPNTYDEKYFGGKTFKNTAMSGEWGTLRSDYRLPISWSLDWAGPNDKRPNSGIGAWWIENNTNMLKLNLYRTTISDGTYTDFKFYKYKDNVFAIPR